MRPFLLLAALAAVTSGCDLSGRVEAEIEAALPKALGPADTYDATVEGLKLRAGEADRVAVVGRRVAREDAPVVDQLDLVMWGVAFDRSTKRLTRVDSARATARLLPEDLAAYLVRQRGVARAEIDLASPDRATVRFQGEVEGVRIPVGAEVVGRIRAEGGHVNLDVDAVRAAGFSLGGALARRLDEQINPVVDLTDEDLALEVTDVRVEAGVLVLEARGDPTGFRLRRSG